MNFIYSIGIIRAIEEAYPVAYQNGIEFYRKGILVYYVTNPISIAEYRADFWRGCKHIGRVAGKGRMSYKQVERMVSYLNGQD